MQGGAALTDFEQAMAGAQRLVKLELGVVVGVGSRECRVYGKGLRLSHGLRVQSELSL